MPPKVLCGAYLDIDNFKCISDTHGHLKGDEILKCMANVMSETIREIDTPCRYGGDEFCLILNECDTENSVFICDKILTKLNKVFPDVSVSMGIAETGPDKFVDGDSLLSTADKNLYEAKRSKPTENSIVICNKTHSKLNKIHPNISMSIGIAETALDELVDRDSSLSEADSGGAKHSKPVLINLGKLGVKPNEKQLGF